MTAIPTLQELIEQCRIGVLGVLQDSEDTSPMIDAVIPNRPAPLRRASHHANLKNREKDTAAAALSALMKREGIIAYCCAMTCWFAEASGPGDNFKLPPSKRSNRREGVSFMAANRFGVKAGAIYEIDRNDDGTFKGLKDFGKDAPDNFSGRLIELLDDD